MRIGIIGSGHEVFVLLEVLNRFDHEYHLFCDRKMRPWGDKDPALRQERVMYAANYLQGKVDALILPPVCEGIFLAQSSTLAGIPILPLFSTYIREEVLPHSLVGKWGLLCEWADMFDAQKVIQQLLQVDNRTERQLTQGKKFHRPIACWKKDLRMWMYYLTTYGKRTSIMHTTIKHDLIYFHDAAVDTLVPMSRGFLRYQRLISHRVSRKKMRFHGADAVARSFENTLTQLQGGKLSPAVYDVHIHTTDTLAVLLREKKWSLILSKGGAVSVHEHHVSA